MSGVDLSSGLPRIGSEVLWHDGARERRGEVRTYQTRGDRVVVTVRDPEAPALPVTVVVGADGALQVPPATGPEARALAAAVLAGRRVPLGVEAQLTLLAAALLTRDAGAPTDAGPGPAEAG